MKQQMKLHEQFCFNINEHTYAWHQQMNASRLKFFSTPLTAKFTSTFLARSFEIFKLVFPFHTDWNRHSCYLNEKWTYGTILKTGKNGHLSLHVKSDEESFWVNNVTIPKCKINCAWKIKSEFADLSKASPLFLKGSKT